jgi:hypothetical protein
LSLISRIRVYSRGVMLPTPGKIRAWRIGQIAYFFLVFPYKITLEFGSSNSQNLAIFPHSSEGYTPSNSIVNRKRISITNLAIETVGKLGSGVGEEVASALIEQTKDAEPIVRAAVAASPGKLKLKTQNER